MPDDETVRDMAPDASEVSLISGLTGALTEPGNLSEPSAAEQGDAPADVGSRPAPPLQPTSREHLNAEEVERLLGTDAEGRPDSDVSES
ncbi:hypothetical protein MF271_10425 [Deinococcus sp. KNUC1210]|uniref:hypothetical protein n=1 Tax=Deinococcus sp. KNUC1210 TaxID=2917691 RepID=UPI001EF03D1C|nr:hypothetical protein [Deinococcus sp. KNUC1210]ULH14451.1 hypothetical protein MF271_10425 [Deinococcus sp. KNUC1210]